MISFFEKAKVKDARPKQNISIIEFLDGVKNGRWEDIVHEVRTGKRPKDSAPAVTPSGQFTVRSISGLQFHSGLINIDIDQKDQICNIDYEALQQDDFTFAIHDSISGNGGKALYVRIISDKHKEAFIGLQDYYLKTYGIVIDKSCSDVSRLRFVSHDPHLYLNEKSKIFKQYLPKKEVQRIEVKRIVVKSDFDDMVNQASSMNLYDDYSDYIKLSFALSSEFGEGGREYFHALSRSSEKYNSELADKHFDVALKRQKTGITINTVYWKFANAGISLQSEQTKQIKTIVKLSDNPEKVLKEMNIQPEEGLIEKIKHQENKNEEKTEIDEVIDLIRLEKIRFNEITRNFEFGDEEMTDRNLARFYTKVWQKIDDGISKDKIFTLIQNRDNSESFNPIHDWFKKHSHLKPFGNFQKLKECFDFEAHVMINGEKMTVHDYLDTFLKKWLLGIIGSVYGTYSLMILVLTGEQGIRKTEFFRNLLPEPLRKFYAESNLDEGKDSEILMTKKLLIIDDEFGGKSKKDATKLKRLSSQQTFSIRMPYGRVSEDLKRLAVLGGTSNEREIINDPTGNRRIIPINLISFDFEKYKRIDKTELFIELYHEWMQNKEGWFLNKSEIEILNATTIKNTEIMSEAELITKHYQFDQYGRLTNTDIKLQLENRYPSFRTTSKRLGAALKMCGFENVLMSVDGKTKRVYNVILID
jgi:predicted P-loop ATPase